MQQYIADKKDAWHCAVHILESRSDYMNGFIHSDYKEYPEIRQSFARIGEKLPFS
jgi:hypothetical protein